MVINELLKSWEEFIVVELQRASHESHSLEACSKYWQWQYAHILFLKKQSYKFFVGCYVAKVFQVQL